MPAGSAVCLFGQAGLYTSPLRLPTGTPGLSPGFAHGEPCNGLLSASLFITPFLEVPVKKQTVSFPLGRGQSGSRG